jgi:hypothetical protein
VRLVPVVPPPRRIALVPLEEDGDEVDVDPPLRDVAELDEPEDVDDPDEEDPLDELEPLDGGADRTGCCSEYDGLVKVGLENVGAGGGDSRMTADDGLAGAGGGGAAVSTVGGADRGTAWAAPAGEVTRTIALPASKVSKRRL